MAASNVTMLLRGDLSANAHLAVSFDHANFFVSTGEDLVVFVDSATVLVDVVSWPRMAWLLFEIHLHEVPCGLVIVLLDIEHVVILQDLIDAIFTSFASLKITV